MITLFGVNLKKVVFPSGTPLWKKYQYPKFEPILHILQAVKAVEAAARERHMEMIQPGDRGCTIL